MRKRTARRLRLAHACSSSIEAGNVLLDLRPGCENCDADLAMIDGAAHPAVIGTPEQVNKAIMDWAGQIKQ